MAVSYRDGCPPSGKTRAQSPFSRASERLCYIFYPPRWARLHAPSARESGDACLFPARFPPRSARPAPFLPPQAADTAERHALRPFSPWKPLRKGSCVRFSEDNPLILLPPQAICRKAPPDRLFSADAPVFPSQEGFCPFLLRKQHYAADRSV